MTRSELLELVDEVRSLCCELDTVEVKLAATKVPRRLFEVMSAFANSDGGGVIIFGLDEANGFEVVGVSDPQKLQSDVTALARDQMEPLLKPDFSVASIEGRTVVGVRIPPLPPSRRTPIKPQAGPKVQKRYLSGIRIRRTSPRDPGSRRYRGGRRRVPRCRSSAASCSRTSSTARWMASGLRRAARQSGETRATAAS